MADNDNFSAQLQAAIDRAKKSQTKYVTKAAEGAKEMDPGLTYRVPVSDRAEKPSLRDMSPEELRELTMQKPQERRDYKIEKRDYELPNSPARLRNTPPNDLTKMMKKGGKISLKNCKVSTASKNKSTKNW